MASQLTFEELFDPDFLERLDGFNLRFSRFIRSGRQAEQPSRESGFGLEFKDFKPYVPGDDLRSIDWNIYQRLGRLFVQVFEEYQDVPVYLLCDRSRSMYLEQPPRINAALRTGLALASVALSQHDRVTLFSFSDAFEIHTKPLNGKSQLAHLARRMVELNEQENTQLADAVDQLSMQRLRQGLVVVISDFFDPAGIDTVLESLRLIRHRLLLVQIVKDTDSNPTVDEELIGDLRLTDCENGNAIDVTIEPTVIARYRRIYEAFVEQLTGFAAQQAAGLIQVNAEQDVLDQLASIFESGRVLV